MRPVAWTSLAERDLEVIDEYWFSVSQGQADRVIDRIRAAGDFLATMPHAGPALETGPARKWRVKQTDYILMYRVIADQIQVLRIRHAQENWREIA